MRIVLDAMGSDAAPEPEVRGAVEASLESPSEFVLVGDEPVLRERLRAFPKRGSIPISSEPWESRLPQVAVSPKNILPMWKTPLC